LLAIGFTALILLIGNLSFAVIEEKKQSSGSKTYTNNDYSVKIQYPKNWKKSGQDLPAHVIVDFTAPDAKDGSQTAGVLIANCDMSNDTSKFRDE
jgi:hypothetical protein